MEIKYNESIEIIIKLYKVQDKKTMLKTFLHNSTSRFKATCTMIWFYVYLHCFLEIVFSPILAFVHCYNQKYLAKFFST